MADDEKAEDKSEVPDGPGAAFMSHMVMEDLIDKLKLVGYENELLRNSSAYKPITRYYFAITTNPGEQFFMFTTIAAWLIQKASNKSFEMPKEHDDPNATITNILDELRSLDFAVDFPPNKLKSGSGEHCIFVLDRLADAALKESAFTWQRAEAAVDDNDEEDEPVDETEITTEQFEDEEPEAADDDDDAAFLDLNIQSISTGKMNQEEKKEILQSDTTAIEWKMEVERVMPSLKIQLRPDAKDWRSHLDQMKQYQSTIGENLTTTKSSLERVEQDISRSLEKIGSREKYLNQQLESLLHQFRSSQDRLAEVREKYKEASGGVTERQKVLQQVTEELEQVRAEMEERGSGLTDGAPLVKIKQAITRLQQEIVAIDTQIGVADQAILQSQLRDRVLLQHDMNAGLSAADYVV